MKFNKKNKSLEILALFFVLFVLIFIFMPVSRADDDENDDNPNLQHIETQVPDIVTPPAPPVIIKPEPIVQPAPPPIQAEKPEPEKNIIKPAVKPKTVQPSSEPQIKKVQSGRQAVKTVPKILKAEPAVIQPDEAAKSNINNWQDSDHDGVPDILDKHPGEDDFAFSIIDANQNGIADELELLLK